MIEIFFPSSGHTENRVCEPYLAGVHTSFEDSSTQHLVCDLVLHQTLARCAVHNADLRLLQDGCSKSCRKGVICKQRLG